MSVLPSSLFLDEFFIFPGNTFVSHYFGYVESVGGSNLWIPDAFPIKRRAATVEMLARGVATLINWHGPFLELCAAGHRVQVREPPKARLIKNRRSRLNPFKNQCTVILSGNRWLDALIREKLRAWDALLLREVIHGINARLLACSFTN